MYKYTYIQAAGDKRITKRHKVRLLTIAGGKAERRNGGTVAAFAAYFQRLGAGGIVYRLGAYRPKIRPKIKPQGVPCGKALKKPPRRAAAAIVGGNLFYKAAPIKVVSCLQFFVYLNYTSI